MSKADGDDRTRRQSPGLPAEAYVSASFLRLLDAWRSAQTDQPTRSEALKRLAILARPGRPPPGDSA